MDPGCSRLVMFMQPGFALVEAGFTRSKNTANILMKNLMDFSIGSLIFWFMGYTFMYGEDIGGFIGKVSLFFGSNEINGVPEKASLMFQTVFAATAATIVSGAVAERTKFSAYLVFSVAITAIIYPISGHWVWGGGWLSDLVPFPRFCRINSGPLSRCMGRTGGATVIGPRIGKYSKDGKPRAIPGSKPGAGCTWCIYTLVWMVWFQSRFTACCCRNENASAISHIFITTNLAAAAGAVTAMVITWIKYKRPGLSLTLNGALAGLVAITAGCDVVSPGGAVIIGILAGMSWYLVWNSLTRY